jgi:hypothetical protein
MNKINSSFGEIDLLRFVFELNQQPVDSFRLQQMVFDHQARNSRLTPPPEAQQSPTARTFNPQPTNASTPSPATQIPEPRVVFNYVPSIPTPAPTPEPEPQPTNALAKLKSIENIIDWCGNSVYHNLPDVAMVEYDKMLRESHVTKAEVIRMLHEDAPINYDYNPNKSRIRTNYENPTIAEGRTKNNIASRRSRQRKKFYQHVLQYSVEYDEDENFLLEKQEVWLRGIIENLERKVVEKEGGGGEEGAVVEEIVRLRKQCGFN